MLAAAEWLQGTFSAALGFCIKFSEGFHDSYSPGLIISFINMMALVRNSPGILWHHLGPSRTLHALKIVETALTVGSEFPVGPWGQVSKRIKEVSFIHWVFCPKGLNSTSFS